MFVLLCLFTGSDNVKGRYVREKGVETIMESLVATPHKIGSTFGEVTEVLSRDVPGSFKDSIPTDVLTSLELTREMLDAESFKFYDPTSGNHRMMALQKAQREGRDVQTFPPNLKVPVVLLSIPDTLTTLLYASNDNDIRDTKV